MKSGVYQMPMQDYLAEHAISQSSLKKLEQSPAHLRYYLDHPEPSTYDQEMGTVFHTAVFEPDRLKECCYVIPSHYETDKGEKKPWHGGANFCKDWLAQRKDKPKLHQVDFSTVLTMRDSVANHPAAKAALKTGKAEQSLFAEDPDTGLNIKCRCDWLSGNSIVDLKKCQDASPTGFAKSVANYGYDVQAAANLWIAALLGLGKEHFLFCCVEDYEPYACAVYELDAESIDIGRSKYRRLLNRYLECVCENQWPGYSKNVEMISLPQYAKRSELNAIFMEDHPNMPALEIA